MALAHTAIVCGVDGSADSMHLARISARLAEMLDARLRLVHVLGMQRRDLRPVETRRQNGEARRSPVSEVGRFPLEGDDLDAQRMLIALSEAVGAPDAERHVVAYGDPARRIAAVAERRGTLLVVVGTRGVTAAPDAMLGSVSGRLAADAPCPVLVVPPHLAARVDPPSWPNRTFVCGLDGSEAGWNAARQTALLAARIRSEVMLVSVGCDATPSDDEVFRRLESAAGAGLGGRGGEATLAVRRDVRHGDPAWELERVASALTAPLIAVGSRGLGPEDALLGAVARRLLGVARRPILMVPATPLLETRAA